MKNKYSKQSEEAPEASRIKKSCVDKKAFESKELALQKGQRIYKCKYCGMWHRSGKFAKFVYELKHPKHLPKLKIKYRR